MDPALVEAYRRSEFRVDEGLVRLAFRVGDRCEALDAMLAADGVDGWLWITAWNPHSQPTPERDNAELGDTLEKRLAAHRTFAGVGHGPDGWEERGLLVLGIPRDEAEVIGRAFRQNAVIWGRRGGAAELVLLDGS